MWPHPLNSPTVGGGGPFSIQIFTLQIWDLYTGLRIGILGGKKVSENDRLPLSHAKTTTKTLSAPALHVSHFQTVAFVFFKECFFQYKFEIHKNILFFSLVERPLSVHPPLSIPCLIGPQGSTHSLGIFHQSHLFSPAIAF